MSAALSAEGRITQSLRVLDCSARNFVAIARSLGVDVNDAKLSRAMNDLTPLDRETGDKLLNTLDRMRQLQSFIFTATDSFITVDWSKTDKVSTALAVRLLADITRDTNDVDNEQAQKAADYTARQTVSQQ